MLNSYSSALMLSCNNEKHLLKIPNLKAACIMLNLEDGVSSQDKSLALQLCVKYLEKFSDVNKIFVVRVNALQEGGLEEIKYLNKYKPHAIRVPKIKTTYEIQKALNVLDDGIELHLSIETAQAWNNLHTFKIDTRITTFYLGFLDMLADMQLPHSMIKRDNPTILYMLSHFLITCKSMNINPVSFVYQDYQNLEEFKKWVLLEKKMGYSSKGCISPSQVDIVNEVFCNDADEIIKAKKIIELFEYNRKNGITGFSDDEFGFIDEPIYKGALSILNI